MFKLAVVMVVLVALFALAVSVILPHIDFCHWSADPGVQQACKVLGQSSAIPVPMSAAFAPLWLVTLLYHLGRTLVARFANQHGSDQYSSFAAWSHGALCITVEDCNVLDTAAAELCFSVPYTGRQIVLDAIVGNPEECQPRLRCSVDRA